MARSASSSSKRRKRLRWLIGCIVGVAVFLPGGYALYSYQWQQNTQRVLATANDAADKQDWRIAVQEYRQYLYRVPSAPEVLASYAHALIELAKEDPRVISPALETLKKLNRIDATNLYGISELAKLYIALGEYRPAEQLAQQWIAVARDNPEAHAILAAARHGLGTFDLAAAGLVEAIKQMPHETTLYPLLISTYQIDLQDKEAARLWMDRGLQADPQSPEIHLAAYAFFRSEQDNEKAQYHLDQALALGPQRVPVLLAAARAELDRGNPDSAKTLLDRVETIEPSHRGRLQLLAIWARTTHANESLVLVADEMVAKANDIDIDLIAHAAELYIDARQTEKADKCIEIITQQRSRSPSVQIWLHALKGSRALLAQNGIEAAQEFELVLKLSPNDEKTLELAALAYRDSNNLNAAAVMYRRLLLVNDQSVSAKLGLAQIDWLQGRRENIRSCLGGVNPTTDRQRQLHEILSLAAELTATPFATLSEQRKQDVQKKLIARADTMTANSMASIILADCFALTDFAPACGAWVNEHLQDNDVALTLALRYAGFLQSTEADQALILRNKIISAYPNSSRAHLLQLRALLAENQPEKVRQYTDTLNLAPQTMGELWRGLAAMQRALGQTDNACVSLRQALSLNAQDSMAARLLAELTPDRDESLKIAEDLRQQFGEDDLHWRVIRASALLQSKSQEQQLREATQLLQYCINKRPRWVQPSILLGDAYALQGQLNQSVEIYRSAISEQPELGTGPVAARLVTALNRLGRFIEADAVLNDLTRVNPDEPAVLRLRTEYYSRTNDLSSAIETAERLLVSSGDDPVWAATTSSLQWRSGHSERAESIARDFLQRHPQSPALWWSLSRALVAQEKDAEAVTTLQQAAKTHRSGELYVLLAQLHAGLSHTTEAESAIAKALELDPNNATVLASCAQFWAIRGQSGKQRTLMERSLIAAGEDPNTSIRLARLFISSGLPEDLRSSAKIVQNRLMQSPDDAQALAIKGQLAGLSQPPDYDSAERCLQDAINSDQTIPQVHQILASVQIRQGKLIEADKTVSAGLAIDPNDTDLLLASAELSVYRGQHARAIAPLRQVLQSRADDYAALDLLATSYMALGHRDQAIKFIRQITPKDRSSVGAIVSLARLYESKGDEAQSRKLWNQIDPATTDSSVAFQALLRYHARKHDWLRVQEITQARRQAYPLDIDSLKFAAQVLGLRQDNAEAQSVGIAWLREIAQSHPAHGADAIYRLGLCFYESQQYADAESHFLQAIDMNPNSADIVNALAWLYCEHMNKAKQASQLIDRFLASGGQPNAQMLDTHGVILAKLGQTNRAKSVLRMCIRVAGQTPTLTAATYHLGMVLAQAGEHELVDRQYREALTLNNRLGGLTQQENDTIEKALGNNKLQ